jgi:hypothetical protein
MTRIDFLSLPGFGLGGIFFVVGGKHFVENEIILANADILFWHMNFNASILKVYWT